MKEAESEKKVWRSAPMTSTQLEAHDLNGSAEIERLTTQVGQLRAECARLAQALKEAAVEGDLARKTLSKVLAQIEREKREFEDVDIASLEAISAGPVEMLS
jgi:hypothetical protein